MCRRYNIGFASVDENQDAFIDEITRIDFEESKADKTRIDYNPKRKQLNKNDEDVLPDELYDVLMSDNTGGAA